MTSDYYEFILKIIHNILFLQDKIEIKIIKIKILLECMLFYYLNYKTNFKKFFTTIFEQDIIKNNMEDFTDFKCYKKTKLYNYITSKIIEKKK